MEFQITAYEAWMKPQVAAMFSAEYGVSAEEFAKRFENFYEHPFQAKRCIRIVALDEKRVVGFQSFFYWPYRYGEKIYQAFQSGNSLVDPGYRGKGIFGQLLDFVEAQREKLGIDFFLGFPVRASRNSFLRNKWKNILDLEWFVSPLQLLRPFFGNETIKLARVFSASCGLTAEQSFEGKFRLAVDGAFAEWRKKYLEGHSYFYYCYSENDKAAEFVLKPSRRKKWLRELVLGGMKTKNADAEFLQRAFFDLRKKVKRAGAAHFLSFACNTKSGFYSEKFLTAVRFRKIDRRIFFIVKPFTATDLVEDPSRWILFRSDIDTW